MYNVPACPLSPVCIIVHHPIPVQPYIDPHQIIMPTQVQGPSALYVRYPKTSRFWPGTQKRTSENVWCIFNGMSTERYIYSEIVSYHSKSIIKLNSPEKIKTKYYIR